MIYGGSLQNFFTMTDQNSGIDHQIRPEQLQSELGIAKDAYYAYLKHLNIKASRDSDRKSYLDPEEVNLIRLLREHVVAGGKIADFVVSGALAISDHGDLAAPYGEIPSPTGPPDPAQAVEDDMDGIMREAAELAAHRMSYADQVKIHLASQMTYEDLPSDIQSRVDSVRQSAIPSESPVKIAADLLGRWRQRRKAPNSNPIQI